MKTPNTAGLPEYANSVTRQRAEAMERLRAKRWRWIDSLKRA